MKKRGHIKLWILVGILLSLIEPFNSFALSANISNPSFEEDQPDTTWTCDTSGISCWKSIATGWVLSGSVVTWHPNPNDPVSGYPNGLPDGVNVVAINPSGSIEQTLEEVLREGYTYSLAVDVGRRPDVGSIQYAVELYAGDTLLGHANGSQVPDAGEFITSMVNYTAQPGDPGAGQPLSIRLANTGTADQVNFDLVSLDVSPTTLELSPIDDQTVEAGELLSVPVSAADSDGQPISLSIVGLPPFANKLYINQSFERDQLAESNSILLSSFLAQNKINSFITHGDLERFLKLYLHRSHTLNNISHQLIAFSLLRGERL